GGAAGRPATAAGGRGGNRAAAGGVVARRARARGGGPAGGSAGAGGGGRRPGVARRSDRPVRRERARRGQRTRLPGARAERHAVPTPRPRGRRPGVAAGRRAGDLVRRPGSGAARSHAGARRPGRGAPSPGGAAGTRAGVPPPRVGQVRPGRRRSPAAYVGAPAGGPSGGRWWLAPRTLVSRQPEAPFRGRRCREVRMDIQSVAKWLPDRLAELAAAHRVPGTAVAVSA